MKRIRIILLSVFISGCSLLNAASNLGWGATSFSKDTFLYGETLSITTFLKNYSSQTFNDTVRLALKINGILNVNSLIFQNTLPSPPINIAGGDSVPATLSLIITPAYYLVGPDILVIWPKANDGSFAHDSIIDTIIVVDHLATAIDDKADKKLKAFYLNETVFIVNEDAEINLNRVRIFDLFGQEISDSPLNGNNSIPFNSQPHGIYFVEVTFNSTERKVLKIAKY